MKQSEAIKASIEGMRDQIRKMEGQIADLNRQIRGYKPGKSQHHLNKQAAYQEITRLEDAIENTQNSIKRLEIQLPNVITAEQAHGVMEAQEQEKERQRAVAERAAHDASVKSAALRDWLTVPGQTTQSFEVAWPGIAARIATDRAVQAGAAEAAKPPQCELLSQVALDALAIRYGKKGG